MQAKRGRDVAAEALPAGSIDWSSGSAKVAPAPRSTARRDRGRLVR